MKFEDPHAYLRANAARASRRLQRLVRIPTVNPPGRCYLEMVTQLEAWTRQLGMQSTVHLVPDEIAAGVRGVTPDYPRYNLVARLDVGAPQSVHFNAHYDVVPATGLWPTGGPFEGVLHKGAISGRGAGDMKGSIVALLMAIEALQRTGRRPAFNVECSFTADEETGGELGAGYVVRQGLVNADYAVVCEGGAGTRVGCGHNGVLWLDVELRGKPAHGSRPQDGINAFEAMAGVVRELQGYAQDLAKTERRYLDFDGKARNPTANLGGVFSGGDGDKVNTVPARASFSVDRRIVPSESLRGVEAELRGVLARAFRQQNGARGSASPVLRIEPCVTDPEHELPRVFAAAVRAVRRRVPGFRSTTGFTDLHYFVEEAGLPGIGYGVDSLRAHGVDERIQVRDLCLAARVYAQFMLCQIGC